MENIKDYINSGILELYVLGLTSAEENTSITKLAQMHIEIKNEIDSIIESLVTHAKNDTKEEPNATVKPIIMAIIDYTERLKNGEKPSNPPLLNNNSKIIDFESWINRTDFITPTDYNEIYAKIIGKNDTAFTAIVWIKTATPYETHTVELEKFLIIEGTCDIITDSKTYSLKAGDNFTIPLHEGHIVKVTSNIPCKVILQRVAA